MKLNLKIKTTILGLLLLTSCNLPNLQQGQPSAGPGAWVDQPLDGSSFPLAPVQITSHYSNPTGVAQIEFSVNDAAASTQASPDTKSTLVTVQQTWNPPAPGTYKFTFRGQGNGGAWGEPASVTIFIVDVIKPSTSTATPVSTNTSTPLPTSAAPLFTLSKNAFCRKGPGVNFPDITAIIAGEIVEIKGMSDDGFWYNVFWKKFNVTCWVGASTGQVSGDLQGVPALVSPDTPSPTQVPVIIPLPTKTFSKP